MPIVTVDFDDYEHVEHDPVKLRVRDASRREYQDAVDAGEAGPFLLDLVEQIDDGSEYASVDDIPMSWIEPLVVGINHFFAPKGSERSDGDTRQQRRAKRSKKALRRSG